MCALFSDFVCFVPLPTARPHLCLVVLPSRQVVFLLLDDLDLPAVVSFGSTSTRILCAGRLILRNIPYSVGPMNTKFTPQSCIISSSVLVMCSDKVVQM